MLDTTHVVPAGLLAAIVSWLGCLWLIRHARGHAQRYAAQRLPQRFHMGAVPRVGAAAMGIGVLVSVGWLTLGLEVSAPQLLSVWGVLALLVLAPSVLGGLAEDVTQRLSVRFRLGLTGLSAALAVMVLDVTIPRLGVPWLDAALLAWPWLGMALAWLAVAGLPHGFNLIDGYNGLAGTVAVVVGLALVAVALQVGDLELALLMAMGVGATLGFLVWNYPRGLIFAGDGGAYLWGGLIALVSIALVQRHPQVSPWFPMLLLIYPVWETVFSIYRKWARGGSPGVADALHLHQLVYRRIVREVFHDDAARRMLSRNNRTSPYLWGFALLTVIPAVLFWRHTTVLMAFCALFVLTYVPLYLMIVRFKVPRWIRRGRGH